MINDMSYVICKLCYVVLDTSTGLEGNCAAIPDLKIRSSAVILALSGSNLLAVATGGRAAGVLGPHAPDTD